jgi:CheY-like chemotaxis protein
VFSLQAKEASIAFDCTCDEASFADNELMSPTVFLNVDKPKISQVLRNLVSNAIKFTSSPLGKGNDDGKGSQRTVTVHVSVDEVPVTVKTDEDIDCDTNVDNHSNSHCNAPPIGFVDVVRVEVRDSGPGISAEDQSKLFDQIIQFNPNKLQGGGGSGLGLFISKGIMDLHEGRIGVSSQGEGKGACFFIEIPILKTAVENAQATIDAENVENILNAANKSSSASSLISGTNGRASPVDVTPLHTPARRAVERTAVGIANNKQPQQQQPYLGRRGSAFLDEWRNPFTTSAAVAAVASVAGSLTPVATFDGNSTKKGPGPGPGSGSGKLPLSRSPSSRKFSIVPFHAQAISPRGRLAPTKWNSGRGRISLRKSSTNNPDARSPVPFASSGDAASDLFFDKSEEEDSSSSPRCQSPQGSTAVTPVPGAASVVDINRDGKAVRSLLTARSALSALSAHSVAPATIKNSVPPDPGSSERSEGSSNSGGDSHCLPAPLPSHTVGSVHTPVSSSSSVPVAANTTTAAAVQQSQVVPDRKLRVLVVDDSVATRKMIVRCLKTKKLCESPLEAEDGAEAVRIVRASGSCGTAVEGEKDGDNGGATACTVAVPIDAVLMDFVMPVMDGPSAAHILRGEGYKGLIVGITGNALPDDKEYYLGCGADIVLTKPVDVPQLVAVLTNTGVQANNVPVSCALSPQLSNNNTDTNDLVEVGHAEEKKREGGEEDDKDKELESEDKPEGKSAGKPRTKSRHNESDKDGSDTKKGQPPGGAGGGGTGGGATSTASTSSDGTHRGEHVNNKQDNNGNNGGGDGEGKRSSGRDQDNHKKHRVAKVPAENDQLVTVPHNATLPMEVPYSDGVIHIGAVAATVTKDEIDGSKHEGIGSQTPTILPAPAPFPIPVPTSVPVQPLSLVQRASSRRAAPTIDLQSRNQHSGTDNGIGIGIDHNGSDAPTENSSTLMVAALPSTDRQAGGCDGTINVPNPTMPVSGEPMISMNMNTNMSRSEGEIAAGGNSDSHLTAVHGSRDAEFTIKALNKSEQAHRPFVGPNDDSDMHIHVYPRLDELISNTGTHTLGSRGLTLTHTNHHNNCDIFTVEQRGLAARCVGCLVSCVPFGRVFSPRGDIGHAQGQGQGQGQGHGKDQDQDQDQDQQGHVVSISGAGSHTQDHFRVHPDDENSVLTGYQGRRQGHGSGHQFTATVRGTMHRSSRDIRA